MKEGWKYVRLCDVCTILDSRRKPITKAKREKGLIPYYGATGLLDYVKDFIFDETLVLLGEDGAKWGAGEKSAYLITGKSWVNNHAHTLSPNSKVLSNYWLIYYLNYSDLSGYITGVTVPKLNQEKMRSIPIPLPPLSEQEEIVTNLDTSFAKIDAIKANAEKELEEAKKLFAAALNEAMTPKEGWVEKTLPDISENLDSRRKPVTKGKRETGIYPYYGASGIVDYVSDYIFDEDILLISEDGANLIARSTPIAFSVSGKVWVNNHAHILKFKNLTTQHFIEYYFASIPIDDYVTGAAQPKLNQKKLNSIPLWLPSLSDQHSIVTHLDTLSEKVRQLQSNYEKISSECDALRQAILRETFE